MAKKIFAAILLILTLSTILPLAASDKARAEETPAKLPTSATETQNNNKIGLLLVLSQLGGHRNGENYYAPRSRTEVLRTVWLTADGYAVSSAVKQGFAVAPGPDGFYKIEQIHGELKDEAAGKTFEVSKIITYKIGVEHPTQVSVRNEKYLVYSSEGFHCEFIGGGYYSALHMRVYTSGAGGYQYHPGIRFCKLGYSLPATLEDAGDESGRVSIRDILPPELQAAIDSQIQAYRDELNRTVKKESDKDKQYISEADLTLRHTDGRWRLMVPLQFSNWKYSHNHFISFHEIDCPLPESLVGHNELCIPFDEIRRHIPDATDAVSSPDKWMLVVQTPDSLKVYIDPLKNLEKPVYVVPINGREKIVLTQWSHGKALAQWDEELTRLLD